MSKHLPVPAMILLAASLPISLASAEGTKPVTTGPVIRGISLPYDGVPGEKAGIDCRNFSREEVDITGNMTDASVQCRPGGTVADALIGLPGSFNAYCVFDDAGKLGGARLIQAPIRENVNHCSLSAMTPKDAQGRFGGATWR